MEPTSVNIDFMGSVTGPGVSARANTLLLKFILQHYFSTDRGAPPGDQETPAAYAARVRTDAMAGQDWALLKKTLTVDEWMHRNIAGTGGTPDDETSGLNLMIDGINQSAAGQYALAVASFQNALRSGTLNIPAKFIGEQLDVIKHDHPDDYDAGIQMFISPTVPNIPSGMNPALARMLYNRQAGFTPGMGMPGYYNPGFNPLFKPAPDPVLHITGAQTNAAPATSARPPGQ